MVYPKANLPAVAAPWGRYIEKDVINLQTVVATERVNNAARDAQLLSSQKRLDSSVKTVAAAATAAQAALDATDIVSGEVASLVTDVDALSGQVDEAVTDVATLESNIYFPGTTTIDGGNIRTGTIGANQISASYVYAGSINADNITSGTITGRAISGGTITGALIQTAAIGGVQLNNSTNSVTFRNGSTVVGHIVPYASNGIVIHYGSVADGNAGAFPQSYVGSANVMMAANQSRYVSVNTDSVNIGGPTYLYGNTNIMASMYYSGRPGSSTIGTPIHVRTSGASVDLLFAYTSAREYKTNIADLEIDYEKFMSIPIKSFNYKTDVEEFGDNAQVVYGYIADDVYDAGFKDLVVYKDNPDGGFLPHSLAFNSITAITQAIVNKQSKKIEELEARISALEIK